MSTKPSFKQAFSSLIDHLRTRPDGDAKTQRLLRSLSAKVPRNGMVIEAGVERESTLQDQGLLGRMHRRRIETITMFRDPPPGEILELARALAADDGPIPVTDHIHVAFVVDITPAMMTDRSEPVISVEDAEIPLVVGFDTEEDRAPRLSEGPSDERQLQLLSQVIKESERRGSWTEALHAAQALTHFADRAASSRGRQLAIAGRRVLSPSLLQRFIDHAIRVPEERPRVVQVLEWAGGDAAEVVIDALAETESIGPKAFLCDLAARLPDAYPMVEALLRSPYWYQASLGAYLLGLRGASDSVGALVAQSGHSDARVRRAITVALGNINAPTNVEPLLRALADPDATVREAAARGLGSRAARGATMTLAQTLERERDPTARTAMIAALGAMGTDEAAAVLSTVAVTRRSLFARRGYAVDQRLAAVAALADCQAHGARRALERVANEARGEVAEAALRAVENRVPEARRDQSVDR